MSVISVTQSGGFAGRVQHGTIDTGSEPGGSALEAFLKNRRPGLPRTIGTDRLVYTFQVAGKRVTLGAEELPAELASVVRSAFRR